MKIPSSAASPSVQAETATAPPLDQIDVPPVSEALARQILISLMFPSALMPLLSSMSRIALPIIRDDFQIQADMTAWVASVFTLPFMVLMPLYGRLSDGVGRRRLILAGIAIFTLGTAITIFAPSLAWLMAGRAIQGVGTAGMMPLGMAFISTIFPAKDRGKALGTWSSIGPTTAFLSPLLAGFLVDFSGWRAAFVPPLAVGIIAFAVVYQKVPAGLSTVRPNFLRTFDWAGVLLLSGGLTLLLFYLSSRPITGVAPLHDWRLLGATLILMTGFVWWERRRRDPFVALNIFRNKLFSLASFCASMRMFTMAGLGFLVPLYLVDVHGLTAAYIGLIAMVAPGTMSLITRLGGQIADRWGSRWPTLIGLGIMGAAMATFFYLPESTSLWVVAGVTAVYGVGAGFTLAAIHRAALSSIDEAMVGSASGLYSMIRFAGAMIGTALAGVLLQNYLDQGLSLIVAYQRVFLFFAGFALVGALTGGFGLREPKA